MDSIYDSEAFVDLYNILDIDMEAKSDEIKNAYLKLVKTHHPDHGGNPEMFQQITKAYEILKDKENRKEYDLYYLKKSMDEFKGDDFNRLRADYKNFVNANTKPVSKEKLDEIYADIFKDKDDYKEIKMESNELSKRMNDINFERDNLSIENSNDKMLEILNEINKNSTTPITISEFFEYLKQKNQNTSNEIVVGELGTLDTLPGYSSNFTSFVSDNEFFGSNLYSEIGNNQMDFTLGQRMNNSNDNFNNDSIDDSNNTIDYNDFTKWKNNKKHDNKLSKEDIESYLSRRREEENEIFNNVENNLQNSSKKREVEKFLKTKHLSENIDDYYNKLNEKSDKNKSDNVVDNQDFKPKEGEDMLDYMDRINNEEKKTVSNVRKREFK